MYVVQFTDGHPPKPPAVGHMTPPGTPRRSFEERVRKGPASATASSRRRIGMLGKLCRRGEGALRRCTMKITDLLAFSLVAMKPFFRFFLPKKLFIVRCV